MGSQVHCIGQTPIQVVSQLPVDVECVVDAATGLTNTDFYPLVSFVRCKLHSVYGRILLNNRPFQLADCVPEQHLPTKGSSPSASVALQLVKSSVEEMLALCELSKVKLPAIGWFSSHTWKRTSSTYWSIFFLRYRNYRYGNNISNRGWRSVCDVRWKIDRLRSWEELQGRCEGWNYRVI